MGFGSAMMRRGFALIVFLFVMPALHAEAQVTIGSTCSTAGWTTLQPNQIVYCNSSSVWALGEEITNTGLVGIGTSAPAVKLDLNGSAATFTTGTEDEFHITRQTTGAVSWAQVAAFQLGTYNSSGACCGPQTRLDINLKAASNPTLTGDTNVMTLQSNGNVGIGTTAPGHPLDIVANSVNGIIEMQNTDASAWTSLDFINSSGTFIGSIGYGNSSAGVYANTFYLGSNGPYDLAFQTNAVEHMRVTSVGNVGIGTTAPGAALDVGNSSGSALRVVPTASEVDYLQVTGGASGSPGAVTMSAQGTDANVSIILTPQGTGGIYLNGGTTVYGNVELSGTNLLYFNTNGSIQYTPSNIDGVGGGILLSDASSEPIFINTNGAGPIDLRTNNTSRMLIGATGNVGIGTIVPDSPLTLSSNSSQLQSPGTVSGVMLHLGNADNTNTRILVDAYGAGKYPLLTLRQARGTAASPSASQNNDILGIVTVQGYGATGFQSGSSKQIMWAQAAQNWTDAAQGTSVLYFSVPNGSNTSVERMRIDQSGNIGIGTTAPANTLDVNGSLAVGTYAGTATGASNELIVGGNVGIGTTSPQATLDVNGYARLSLNSSAPVACSSTNAGAIALNHLGQTCSCNGSSWNFTDSTGAACSW